MKMLSPATPAECLPAERLAERLGALSHRKRMEILRYLAASDRCCCKDVVGRLDLAQSTVSQHLKVLVEAGLVRVKPDRQRSIYEIDRAALAATAQGVTALVEACCDEPQPVGCTEPRIREL
jgi:DNA-binding transcriptional ArsR family regulator